MEETTKFVRGQKFDFSTKALLNPQATRVETITPDIAKRMLEYNQHNIPLRNERVNMFVEIINKGLWKLTTDAIGFSYNGKLINGQHRLTACIQANKPITCIVARGLSDDAFMAIDTLNKRKGTADVFYLSGLKYSHNMPSIINKFFLLNRGVTTHRSSGSTILTPEQAKDIYMANAEICNDVMKMAVNCNASTKLLTLAEYGGYALYLILSLHKDRELVYHFFDVVADRGVDYTSNAPQILRKKLSNIKSDKRMRMTEQTKYYLIANAWNAYVNGKDLKVLKALPTNFE